MSNKLNILESKKLFREFNYLMSDVEFKNEFSREYGGEFEREIKDILIEEPIFKQACKDKFGNILDKPIEAPAVNQGDIPSNSPDNVVNIELSESTELIVFTGQTISSEPTIKLEGDNQKLKDLYRKIVQKTHPDKVKSDALNEFYVRATEANKRGDIFTIYAISNELGIKFDISDEEISALRGQVHLIKLQQDSFEKSHFWVWANTKFNGKKKDIIKHFLFHNAPAVKNLFWT